MWYDLEYEMELDRGVTKEPLIATIVIDNVEEGADYGRSLQVPEIIWHIEGLSETEREEHREDIEDNIQYILEQCVSDLIERENR